MWGGVEELRTAPSYGVIGAELKCPIILRGVRSTFDFLRIRL